MPSPNVVIVAKEGNALGNHTISLEGMSPCCHAKADTQIFVHARHPAHEGCKSLLVKASDTDILVIEIIVMPTLQAIGLHQMWIAFGQGRNMRWIPVHELYRLRKAEELHHVMPSLVEMWSQPSVVKERNLHGRPRTYVLRLLVSLPDSASTSKWQL